MQFFMITGSFLFQSSIRFNNMNCVKKKYFVITEYNTKLKKVATIYALLHILFNILLHFALFLYIFLMAFDCFPIALLQNNPRIECASFA